MSNAYGSERYMRFRKEWNKISDNEEWIIADYRFYTYGSYKIKYDTYCLKQDLENYCNNKCRTPLKQQHSLTVYRNNNPHYVCKNIYSGEATFFYFFTYNGYDWLMFHKDDLYGYTLLNLDTLDEHNYFPSEVAYNGGESFIIAEALLWNDIMLLYGCFWACPYFCYLLDLKTYKTRCLSNRGISDNGLKINGDTLTVEYDEAPQVEMFTYECLYNLLCQSDSCDL